MWSQGDTVIEGNLNLLTPQERDVVMHINLARANPAGYARVYLEPRRGMFLQNVYFDPLDPRGHGLRTTEGEAAVAEAVQEMSQVAGMSALTVSAALTKAAQEHAQDQAISGQIGHQGRDFSTPGTRITRHGTWESMIGEVIAYGPVTGREVVSWLLIDDGVKSRGHRRNILNSQFQLIGVAIMPHPGYGHLVVTDFADYVTESGQ
ncbi:MAG TPA: CAP domain-containing protein [Lamprocystis sp. (in: g-proteobacteria)]|nr:CAP domain-containing protein [Lamprocystis sp. (in: g-proteobacteria)]